MQLQTLLSLLRAPADISTMTLFSDSHSSDEVLANVTDCHCSFQIHARPGQWSRVSFHGWSEGASFSCWFSRLAIKATKFLPSVASIAYYVKLASSPYAV